MIAAGIGEAAAFGTAVCWTISAIYFTRASDRIGGVAVNHARSVLSLPFMVLIHLATVGRVFPADVESFRWGWLALSGIVGLVLGDSFLFNAFSLIGPRLSLLIQSTVPILSTTAAWIILGERLAPSEFGGVLVAVAGIGWVVMEKGNRRTSREPRRYALGVLLAFGGAVGQALGLVAAKKGMAGNFPAISATLIRMLAAGATLWGWTLVRGRARHMISAICDRSARVPLVLAIVIGAALGIWLSLVSIQYARLGIAATIMALPPVLILPLAHWQLKERVTARAVFGTVVAFGGIAILLTS